ncbi:MAG TPA: hypothetical protein VJ745_06390 [Gaiellaceae bacterium]|nr:hypothetical protein [Gaiellaceae bacterium]
MSPHVVRNIAVCGPIEAAPRTGGRGWRANVAPRGVKAIGNWIDLAGRRAEFVFLPLSVIDGDGAPARVLARAVEP